MPGTFPKLRTDAWAQYPATRSVQFQNQVLQFVDGTAQRYREWHGSLLQWQIRLDLLDEGELASVEQFFMDNQGDFGSFAFTDPWDGQVYPDCSFAHGDLTLTSLSEMMGQTALTVRQNRV
jgi:hypothetical protein